MLKIAYFEGMDNLMKMKISLVPNCALYVLQMALKGLSGFPHWCSNLVPPVGGTAALHILFQPYQAARFGKCVSWPNEQEDTRFFFNHLTPSHPQHTMVQHET